MTTLASFGRFVGMDEEEEVVLSHPQKGDQQSQWKKDFHREQEAGTERKEQGNDAYKK